MIRCSHCGKLVPAGATSCQSCGMPLVSAGGNTKTGGQFGQQELPAWLESLRTNERPVGNPNSSVEQQPFSVAELVDENAMPSWMHLDQSRLSESSDAFPALSSTTQPGSGKQQVPGTGFMASSLIDEQSLPSWMRDQGNTQSGALQNVSANSLIQPESVPAWMKNLETGQPGPGQGMQAGGGQGMAINNQAQSDSVPAWMKNLETGQPGPGQTIQAGGGQGMAASSLVQSDSVPAWMKNLETGKPGQTMQPGSGQGMAASSLVQSDSVPPWMKNLETGGSSRTTGRQADAQYGLPTQIPGAPPPAGIPNMLPQTPPISTPTGYGGGGGLPAQGFAARDLVDQQSMPSWMTGMQEQSQQAQIRPVPNVQGFAAGDLLDQQSMPSWMKNQQATENSGPVSAMGVPVSGSGQVPGMGQQGTMGGVGMPAANLLDVNSLPPWMREGEQGVPGLPGTPTMQGAQGIPQPGSQGMVAGSLIDVNELPAWMRNSDNPQQQNTGARGGQAPVRFEGVRVPGRPRGDMVPQEQSEAAANVFASMLGVAASSPMPPGQQQTNLGVSQGQPIQPVPPAQSIVPGWQSPAPQMAPNSGNFPWQMPGGPISSAPGMLPPVGNQQQSPMSMGGTQTPMRGVEPPAYTGYGEQNRVGMGPMSGMGGNGNGEAQGEGTKKKGFFDSIRDFFFK